VEEKVDSGSWLVPMFFALTLVVSYRVCGWVHAANVLYNGIACHRLCKLRVHLICDNHDVQ
jgi:hypothetical protein